MYTLRRILEDGYEYNFLLGSTYTVIMKEKVSQDEWDAVSRNYWGEIYDSKKLYPDGETNNPERDCYGFIRSEDGTWHFLLPWQKNYIMIDGKTVSHR